MGLYEGHEEHNRRIGKLAVSALKRKAEERHNEYLKDPTLCKQCGGTIEFRKRRNSFCSKSCSASHNNQLREKKVKAPSTIKEDRFKKRVNLFYEGKLKYRTKIYQVLVHERGNKCVECGILEWNGKKLRLRVDHIDGNAGNNSPENLRLLCPNCDSLTDTYCGRNYGKGRTARGLPID